MTQTKNTIVRSIAVIAGIAAVLGGFAFTARAESLGANVGASAGTTSGLMVGANASLSLSKIITHSDTAIDARITALNKLSARIGEMKNVSATEKSNISVEVATQISNLTTLKAKIDADTDAKIAEADAKTITGDYRIYALIIPQGSIIAASDRVTTIVGLMTALQTKLQARISTAQTAGNDVSVLVSTMTSMGVKLNDATVQAQAAQTAVVKLAPDQGSSSVASANHAALVTGHTDIKAALGDIQGARKDIDTILKGLKGMKVSTSTTTTTTTQ